MVKHFELHTRIGGGNPFYAARCPKLGLTAYGGTEDEAFLKLSEMFTRLLDFHRREGGVARD